MRANHTDAQSRPAAGHRSRVPRVLALLSLLIGVTASRAQARPIDAEYRIERGDPLEIPLGPTTPRRVAIHDATTDELLSEFWLPISSLFVSGWESGAYRILHALDGEPTREIGLVIDVPMHHVRSGQQTLVPLADGWPVLVRIHDLASDTLLSQFWHFSTTLDTASLGVGSYRVSAARSGENFRDIHVHVAPYRHVLSPTHQLPLPGQGPRLLQILTRPGGILLTTFWHPLSSLDLSFLAPGQYRLLHAQSGETWTEVHLDVVDTPTATTATIIVDGDRSRIDWFSVGDAVTYDLILAHATSGRIEHREQVDGTFVDLPELTPGRHAVFVAVAGEPASRSDVMLPHRALLLDAERLAPQQARVHWQPLPGVAAPYYVEIQRIGGGTVDAYWTWGNEFQLEQPPGRYRIGVAPSGGEFDEIEVSLTDFAGAVVAPATPIGTTDRTNQNFAWYPLEDALRYRFSVRQGIQLVVDRWVHETSASETLPWGDYQWRVIAENIDEQLTTDSGWVPLQISDQPSQRANVGVPPDQTVSQQLVHLNYPAAVAVGPDGSSYVSDTLNHVVRRHFDGLVEIYAGTLVPGYNGDGDRLQTQLNAPTGLAVDDAGNLYVADTFNYLVRRIDGVSGQVTPVTGIAGDQGFPEPGLPALGQAIGYCTALSFDPIGNLHLGLTVIDWEWRTSSAARLFSITPAQLVDERVLPMALGPSTITSIAVVDGTAHLTIKEDDLTYYRLPELGAAESMVMTAPYGSGIVPHPGGGVLVGNHTAIYHIDDAMEVNTFSGGFANVVALAECDDGYLAVDSDGSTVVAMDGTGNWLADLSIGLSGTGLGAIVSVASYDGDRALALDNQKPRVLEYDAVRGDVRVVAGNGVIEQARLGSDGFDTGFAYPAGLAVAADGQVYIAEGHRILRIDLTGRVRLFAGAVEAGDVVHGAWCMDARFRGIRDLQFDVAGNLLVADTYNNTVRRIDASCRVWTVAGTGTAGLPELGQPAVAQPLNHPLGILPLADGRLVISDSWNNWIVQTDHDGNLEQVAGVPRFATYQGNGTYSGDQGPAVDAGLNTPTSLALNSFGDLVVVDSFNHRLRVVRTDLTIDTWWGAGEGYASDGSRLNLPQGLAAIDGGLVVGDTGNGLMGRIADTMESLTRPSVGVLRVVAQDAAADIHWPVQPHAQH